MAKVQDEPVPRPEGILERLLYSVEMCETYLGLIVKSNGGVPASAPADTPPAKPVGGKAKGPVKAAAKSSAPAKEDSSATTAVDNLDLDLDVEVTKPAIPTIDECRAALKSYQAIDGREGAIAMLREFKAQNVSTLDEDKRQAFIDRCLGNT